MSQESHQLQIVSVPEAPIFKGHNPSRVIAIGDATLGAAEGLEQTTTSIGLPAAIAIKLPEAALEVHGGAPHNCVSFIFSCLGAELPLGRLRDAFLPHSNEWKLDLASSKFKPYAGDVGVVGVPSGREFPEVSALHWFLAVGNGMALSVPGNGAVRILLEPVADLLSTNGNRNANFYLATRVTPTANEA